MKKVSDVMTRDCSCIKTDQTVAEAARQMAQLQVGALPICGADDKLHGMLTDRDIVVSVIAKGLDPKTCCVEELASDKLVWIEADADLEKACQCMQDHAIRRLPVIENKRLVGIVSQGDIVKALESDVAGQLVEQISQAKDNSGI
jgi:CBS domain-containing protein